MSSVALGWYHPMPSNNREPTAGPACRHIIQVSASASLTLLNQYQSPQTEIQLWTNGLIFFLHLFEHRLYLEVKFEKILISWKGTSMEFRDKIIDSF